MSKNTLRKLRAAAKPCGSRVRGSTTTHDRTPDRALSAILAGPRKVAGLTIHPVTIGTQILLEEIDHPILKVAKADNREAAAGIPIGARDILNLIFIFAQPEEAWKTINLDKQNFYDAARDFGFSVAPAVVDEVIPVIRDMLFQSGTPAASRRELGLELTKEIPRDQLGTKVVGASASKTKAERHQKSES